MRVPSLGSAGRAVALAALSGLLGAALPTATPATALAAGTWQSQAAPFLTPTSGLDGVAAISADDVWVGGQQEYSAGAFLCDGCEKSRPAFVHWNGSSWTSYDFPGLPTDTSGGTAGVDDIDALSATDIWAMGHLNAHGHLAHWNGSAWSQITLPHDGVISATPGQVWVGNGSQFSRWNGGSWRSYTENSTSGVHTASAMTTVSADDAWAVGTKVVQESTIGAYVNQPYIAHWDGTAWRGVAAPDVLMGELTGVTAVSANDVWAVGRVAATTIKIGSGTISTTPAPVVLHYDGTGWSRVDVTQVAPGKSMLKGITTTADGGVQAIGDDPATPQQPLIIRYQGGQWTRQDAPKSLRTIHLTGISRIPGTDQAWAVGYGYLLGRGGPVVYHS